MAAPKFFQGMVAALAVVGTAQAQVTQLWHFEGQVPGSSLRSVAIGASGSQIVSNPDGGSGAVALFTGSQVPTSPVIWSDNTAAGARAGMVRAASGVDLYANLYFDVAVGSSTTQLTPHLSLRHSTAPSALWSKVFNPITANSTSSLPAGLHVAADGSKVVAWWYDSGPAKTYVAAYNAAGALTFAVSMVTFQAPQTIAADADCRRLALVFGSVTTILDASTGAVVKSIYPATNQTSAVALGPGADTLAVGSSTGSVEFYRSGVAPLLPTYTIPGTPGMIPRRAAISADGSTLAVSYQASLDNSQHLFKIYQIGASGIVTMHQRSMQSSGNYASYFTDIDISHDGSVVAASTTGDQNHTFPVLVAFTRTSTGYELTASETLSGSGFDIDLSPDGHIAAIAGSTTHIATLMYMGVVDAFALGGDLTVSGVPHAGTNVVVEQKTGVGLPCVLLVSDALAPSPITYPGMGSLLLATPVRLATAVAGGDGVARFDFTLPSTPASYGHTYYTQGLSLIQRKFTSSYAPVTVVP